MDWNQWSREAVAAAAALNREWSSRFELEDAKYHWDLDRCEILFEAGSRRVSALICLVGTASGYEGSFLWGWANESLPQQLTQKLEAVRDFGAEHDLSLLTIPELQGGVAQGEECLAISARILGAEGVFIDTVDDLTMFFALFQFQPLPVTPDD
ncbi:MAG: hypothetical protein U1E77_09715 [Inhella sp.]